MGRRRNKKKSTSESFPPAAPQDQPADVGEPAPLNPNALPVKAEEPNIAPPEAQVDSQCWSNNIGASADATQGVFSNLGSSPYSVASPDDVAVPLEHVNPLGMAPPGFNAQMPMFMPSYGYPVMQDMSAFQPMSGAMYGDAPYQCPFMNTGSSAVGSQDYQPGQVDAFGGSAIYGSPIGAESGAASTSAMPIGPQQGNIAGAVNDAMMEDPAIILAQGSPQTSVPVLDEEISKIKELASQAIGECQELQQMTTEDSINPNDCWADQVEEEMVELEQQMEAKKLQQKSNAEKAEAAFMEKKGKPSPIAKLPAPVEDKKASENQAVVKEQQKEAEKLQERSSAERAEAAFVQTNVEKSPTNSKQAVNANVVQELAEETKKLQDKTSAEKAEAAFMAAKATAEADKEIVSKAVGQELEKEGKKAQEKVAAERAEAEFVAASQKSKEEVKSEVVSDMAEMAQKTEAVCVADKAQTDHQSKASSKGVAQPTKDAEDDRLIYEALKGEGERSQILMNAVHCEESYFERQSQQSEVKEDLPAATSVSQEREDEKRRSPTEKKGLSWASVVADTTKEASPSPKERDPPKDLGLEKTPPRITPDRTIQKKEKSPPKTPVESETKIEKEKTPPADVEAETPVDATPASVEPFMDEDGFMEPRQARRNRRRKISRRSESDVTDDEKTAQTPEEAAPAGSERAETARDENGNQLAGHRMNIIETDEVSTQTKNTTTSTIESQTESGNKDKAKIQEDKAEDKAKDTLQAELMQEKSQRLAGEGIIKMLETEAEQLRKQLTALQLEHVTVENDYVVAKGDLGEERRLAKEYKSRCSDLEKELQSKAKEMISLQTQLKQKETWIGGTDYMLELKEAKQKAEKADAAISAIENQLKQSQNEVKKLQDQLQSAQDKQNEMVPMATHTSLLQEAEDKAMESEMKVLQLQTELLALQNSQKASNVQVEKQGQTWAAMAAKPSALSKVPAATLGDNAMESTPAAVPEAVSKASPSDVAEATAPAAETAPPKPQDGGSKKEAKNASNNSRGGGKGKSRRSKPRP